ncbi:MAG: nuclear transport factor 2 family protein [Pseudomonadales bacterium]|nr:nuclear transport factor 2 family protein [Pseudomonadales bacterium]
MVETTGFKRQPSGCDHCPPESANNVIISEDGTSRTNQIITNVQINVDEESHAASGHSYVPLYQQKEDHPLRLIFAGEYFDEFVKIHGCWRFKQRDIRHLLVGGLSAHFKNPQAATTHAL